MSESAKKRRTVSMEPILQDFTVTSFSDLNPDVPGPSDSSFFEKIVTGNNDVQINTTLNETNLNLSSGPYPSDSSLNNLSLFKNLSKSKKKVQPPFQKRSTKKSVRDSHFDSLLKNSDPDSSDEIVQKPFQRKVRYKVRPSMFDVELNTSESSFNDSSFKKPFSLIKKPFQRQSKNKRKSNLFDSLIKDSPQNTPEAQISRPFQRKSKNKVSSSLFDEDLSNNSIDESPVQNFITRRTRRRKINESNLFCDDLNSSQSDVSPLVKPLGIKHALKSNHNKENDTSMFDDVFDDTETEDTEVKEPETASDEETMGPETEEEEPKESETEDTEVKEPETASDEETMGPETEEEEPDKSETENKQLKYHDNTETEDTEVKEPETASDKETMGPDTEEEEPEKSETENKQLKYHETEDKEIKELETEGEGAKYTETEYVKNEKVGENLREIVSVTEGLNQSDCSDQDETIKLEDNWSIQSDLTGDKGIEIKENKEKNQFSVDWKSTTSSASNKEGNESLKINDSSKDTEAFKSKDNEDESISCGEISCLADSISIRSDAVSVESTKSLLRPRNRHPSLHAQLGQMPICTPDVSFKDMPSSTPNPKGKRVSFLLKENVHKENIENYVHNATHGNQSQIQMSIRPASSAFSNIQNLDVSHKAKTINETSNMNNNENLSRRKSSLRTRKSSIDKTVSNLTKDISVYSKKRRVSFKIGNDTLTQSNFENSDKLEQSKRNQSNQYRSSISLESLVYENPSESETPNSGSVYLDIHASRGKSTSSCDADLFSRNISKHLKNNVSCANERIVNKESHLYGEKDQSLKKNLSNNDCYKEENLKESIQIDKETSEDEKEKSTLNKEVNETRENVLAVLEGEFEEEEEEGGSAEEGEEEKESEEEEEVESEEEEEVESEEEEEVEFEEEEESKEREEQVSTDEQESEEEEGAKEGEMQVSTDEQESEEEEVQVVKASKKVEEGNIGKEHGNNKTNNTEHEEFHVNNRVASSKRDENVSTEINMNGEFIFPSVAPKLKKKIRRTSIFREQVLEIPSKAQLKEMLNRLQFSELKKKKKGKLSEHSISREQLQQYEIEEELRKNQQQKKSQNKAMLIKPSSNKLKRPKKWVSPKLYDFLIEKLKPQYGIRCRVRAEELVLSLVERVERIEKKKELEREDVEEMKNELAGLGIVRTHWDFFLFVNKFFDFFLKEKMYPSLPGKGHSAFEYGPTNVMENIL